MSRLKSATYTGDGNFGTSYTYDKMGNITTLTRYGVTAEAVNDQIIDNLTFGYTGNQLLYITDTGPNVSLSTSADFKDYSKVTTAEYAFNQNGAMTRDLNKGIVSRSGTSQLDGISYNVLNLPQEMVINNNEVKAKNYYTYTATGAKLKVVYRYDPNGLMMPLLGTTSEQDGLKPKSMTDYIGNKIYEDGVLKMILTDNGYIENGIYYFYITDHLGNNRIVANAGGASIQSTQYYPFGMAFAEGSITEQGKQDYKYNGKELDRTHGLNWYDYSARYVDNAIGRTPTQDPHSEKYYSWSPYVYCFNNPMRWIDKDGRDPGDPFKSKVEAANDFGRYYNGTSVVINKEFASIIYQNSNGTYSYNVARIGGLGWSVTNYDMPKGATREGAIHTHGGDDPQFGDGSYEFSSDTEGDGSGDKAAAERYGQNEYIVTPGGELLEYDVKSKETLKPVGAATDIPSDPKSGAKRVNQVDAKDTKPYYIDIQYPKGSKNVINEYNKPEHK